MKLVYHDQLERDLNLAASYYERQCSGLGSHFMAEAEIMIEQIQEFPNAWSVIFDDIRRARLKKFKQYSIRYRFSAEDETIRILTITHSSQHPDTGCDRL